MQAVLRTYATEFDDDPRAAYRASGDATVDGTVVSASSEPKARARVQAVTCVDEDVQFGLQRVG